MARKVHKGKIGRPKSREQMAESIVALDGPIATFGIDPKYAEAFTYVNVDKVEEFWIEESRRNVLAFGEYVFGLRPAKHHIEWVLQIFNPDSNKDLIIAPRGSAKTTWATICLLWFISHNPWTSSMVLSVTHTQASERLQMAADTIRYNERYRKVFPHIRPDFKRSWTKTTISVKDTRVPYGTWRSLVARLGDPKSPTLFAAGVGGSGVVGSRVNGWLLLDDLHDDKNSRTQLMRDSVWSWLSLTVMPILTGKNAKVVHVTTRWAEDDVAGRQIATGEFNYSVTSSLIRDAEGRVASYWPQHQPLATLLSQLRTMGSTYFKLMFLNIVAGLNGEIFTADMLRNRLPDDLPEFKTIVISVDAAVKARESSDDTVITTTGLAYNTKTKLPQMYVLKMDVGKWQPNTVVERVVQAWTNAYERYGKPPVVLFETVAAQEIYITLLDNEGTIPARYIKTYSPNIDKGTRARPLAAAGERGDLFFDLDAPWYPKTFSQFIEFTGDKNNRDDRVDSLTQIAALFMGTISGRTRTNANTKLVKIPHVL